MAVDCDSLTRTGTLIVAVGFLPAMPAGAARQEVAR
jgi:hypothetical protein